MGLSIFTGRIDLTEPDGLTSDYERFILTINPDGSRTLRTVTRSPKGDLLRDVNQMVAPDWRPVEVVGRLFFKNEFQGTVMRRIIGDKIHSYVWTPGVEMDYQVFDAPPKMTLGFHPIFHDAWKMSFLDLSHHEYQDILTHTVSNTWNGRSLGHGMKIKAQVKFDGRETVNVGAGSFACERFIWQTSFGKELHVWRHGPHHMFVKIVVAKGDKEGSVYELASLEEKIVAWP
ncbi:MAG: hypothetical protein FJX59_13165 [Alphaproteobacteria bacterium]|nr:hypothetical protein [Alphaproteobacteria bacterium]